jgi:hypothetical protein
LFVVACYKQPLKQRTNNKPSIVYLKTPVASLRLHFVSRMKKMSTVRATYLRASLVIGPAAAFERGHKVLQQQTARDPKYNNNQNNNNNKKTFLHLAATGFMTSLICIW